MRMPVYSALLPELVSRPQLPQAMALNGIAMNASRIIGPIIAGALIAGTGSIFGNPLVWIERALVVLVAASPCALAIATPSAVLSGVARAARGGVLVKGGAPLVPALSDYL